MNCLCLIFSSGILTIRNELVKVLAADKSVQIIDKVESLFVRHLAESIIRIDAFVVDQKLGELVIFAIPIDGVL